MRRSRLNGISKSSVVDNHDVLAVLHQATSEFPGLVQALWLGPPCPWIDWFLQTTSTASSLELRVMTLITGRVHCFLVAALFIGLSVSCWFLRVPDNDYCNCCAVVAISAVFVGASGIQRTEDSGTSLRYRIRHAELDSVPA